ncbi:MAG: hypothetical protein JWO38_4422 [Gemmataceae bacterium]|nr:hypothetical protein [Gemmataceae bacterium]
MTARRSPPTTTPPQTPSRLFEKSTSGWYAEWKAKRSNLPTAEPLSPATSTDVIEADDAAQKLAGWLTNGAEA